MGYKIALDSRRSACRGQAIGCITYQAGLLVPTLGFTATIQSVAKFTRTSAVEKAALVALGFSTTLGLDIMASLPSLAFRYMQANPRYPMFCCIRTPVELTASPVADSAEYAIGAAILNFSLCYTINLYNLQSWQPYSPGIIPLGN